MGKIVLLQLNISEYTTFQGLLLYSHNVQDTEKESGKD